ncbi:serine/threonine-protein kinase Nek10-like [Gigantopelta aegis]|uniref:serine/threonine-protein kinase Nek10-like n=1 Tax=Gigantopelta aegis TaxID=1735272 RepID=UPI001B88D240|nr:serine/threonine-protein kinase Nek10-like [Gigantopelta aegis]
MSSQERKGRLEDPDHEAKSLCRLLSLIKTPASKQQLPSINLICSSHSKTKCPIPQPKSGACQHLSTEAIALQKFSVQYQSERNFSSHPHHKYLEEVFTALTQQRLCSPEWINGAPPENILRILVCLRILMRDSSFQHRFFEHGGVKYLSEHFKKATNNYLTNGDELFVVDILKEMTNIFQKLSANAQHREWLVACEAHHSLVLLLTASDVLVLHCSLYALIRLAQSEKPRQLIGELNTIDVLLRIIHEYDMMSKKVASDLLRLLCADSQSRDMVRIYDGVPILLSELHSDNVDVLWNVVWCIVQLCEDPDSSNNIRQMGGIPLLLSLLHERKFVTERADASGMAVASARIHKRTPSVLDEQEQLLEAQFSLKSACCAALTELVLNDANAQQIVQANGIYSLGLLILPHTARDKHKKAAEKLQRNGFRALRFLFSMERNRRLFKQLFPTKMYAKFIDIGHYNRSLSSYKPLVEMMNSLPEEEVDEIKKKVLETNQNRAPTSSIGDYAVFELLGSGAFGSVYKVKKKTAGQSFLAMKELNLHDPAFGKNANERKESVGQIQSEVNIIKEQMKHPNIVRYHKTFVENDRLYIVMELIEGAPLFDHFNSLKEKKSNFDENRIWNIFLQMVLALRYLHKEKGIVHRDLSPNNVMLGENDKVTITDFGAAKQKRSDCSKMTSQVGTILYSCPEIVQSQPYGEKADIWSLGCILYQMCTLEPPFFSHNMLTLATKIVEAEYKPISTDEYSKRIIDTVSSCITASPDSRPDILQLSGSLVDIMLVNMDGLRIQQMSLERKLDRERKRTQKHFFEAYRNMQNYHRLFLASQEHYEKLSDLAGSGGASNFKDGDSPSDVFPERGDKSSLSADNLNEADDKGWSSDDDSCPSSGSESRGSSAGSVRSQQSMQRHHSQGHSLSMPRALHNAKKRTAQRDPFSLLTLDIPTSSKTCRDSGLSSGDPSPNSSQSPASSSEPIMNGSGDKPNFTRSHSTNEVVIPQTARCLESRSRSAATLTISPNRLREISDPIIQLLHQLHKIIYISQLPPTLGPNCNRRMIEQYKRALFSPQSNSMNLKNELKKLLEGSRDMIDLNLGPVSNSRRRPHSGLDTETFMFTAHAKDTHQWDPDYKDIGITYEQMQSMIESTLVECGYYSIPTRDRETTPPFCSTSNLPNRIGSA